MILIALTGAPGSGKTTLLTELAAALAARGRRVDGFVAPAEDRIAPDRGAARYDLVFLTEGDRVPFATRDPEATPPYRFEAETQARVLDWAAQLRGRAPDVVVLDEFGPAEVAGKGHFSAWADIAASEPAVVLIAVRPDLVDGLEAKLAAKFDLRVSPDEPDALHRLETICAEPRDWEAVGLFGGGSGAVEMTLGSALHGARVPLRGQVLSTLQALVLTSAAEGLTRRERVAWVAIVAAGLKALSPAGNRLRPMIAIASQGVLFAACLRVLGWNAAAVFVGGLLIGMWATVQGVVLQWVLVGGEIFRAYDAVVKWVAAQLHLGAPAMPTVLGVIVVLSGLLTGFACLAYWRRRHRGLERLLAFAERRRPTFETSTGWKAALKGALRDLIKPTFWMPLAVIVAILKLSGTQWNETFWIVMRASAVGVVLFGLARMISPLRFARWLRRRGLYGPAVGFERAFRRDGS
jgi:nucleoside-triphosphatase THEP1